MIEPLVDAFMSVGVIVAVAMLLIGFARIVWGGRLEAALQRHRRAGPLLGALLSLPPGCVGVMTAVRFYGKGQASYGTAIAALTATMGDSAWLLFARDPWLTVKLKIFLAILGCVVGYAVDAAGLDPARGQTSPDGATSADLRSCGDRAGASPPMSRVRPGGAVAFMRERLRIAPGSAPAIDHGHAAMAAHQGRATDTVVVAAFWLLAIVGAVVSMPVYFQWREPAELAVLTSQIDLYNLVGLAGCAASLVVLLRSRNLFCCGETSCEATPSLRETLVATSREVAFVTVWTALAFVAWELAAAQFGLEPGSLKLTGAIAVVVGAVAGLIPACGVEILFASLFVTGAMPLSGLVAYLISQDGSGLIPLVALRPRSALLSAAITTPPALVVGFAFAFFGL